MENKLTDTGYGERQDYEDCKLEDLPGIEKVITKKPVTFILGDNMQYLRWLKDNMKRGYYHLGIVDPPYGISVGDMKLGAKADSKPRTFEMGSWDNEIPTKEYWDLIQYCCRNVIVWGGNYFTKELYFSGRCFVLWDKKNDKVSFAPGELALTSFDDRNCIFIRRSIASKTDEETEKRHPTQKPIYLYDALHLEFLEKGQRVLDTHGGSHSHALAAFKNGTDLTIIEREKSYHDSALVAYDTLFSGQGRMLF